MVDPNIFVPLGQGGKGDSGATGPQGPSGVPGTPGGDIGPSGVPGPVGASGPNALSLLTDVSITGPLAQDDVIAWDVTSSKWTQATIESGISGTSARQFTPFGAYFTGTALQIPALVGNNANTARIQGSNFCSTTLTATNTGTMEIVLRLSPINTDGTSVLFSKRIALATSGGQEFQLQRISDSLEFRRSVGNGSTTGVGGANALINEYVAQSNGGVFSGDTIVWIKVIHDPSTGITNFYKAADSPTEPGVWTSAGSVTHTIGTVYSNSVAPIIVGCNNASASYGTFYKAILRNSLGATTYDANFANAAADGLAFLESANIPPLTVSLTTERYSFGLPNEILSVYTTPVLSMAANQTCYKSFLVTSPINVDMFQFNVTSAPASTAALGLAIYSADNSLQPTTLKVQSGSIQITTTGTGQYYKQITPTLLNPGQYLIAINTSFALGLRAAYSFSGNNMLTQTTASAELRTRSTLTGADFSALATPAQWVSHGVPTTNEPNKASVFLRWTGTGV